jgi:hypothetical protein
VFDKVIGWKGRLLFVLSETRRRGKVGCCDEAIGPF